MTKQQDMPQEPMPTNEQLRHAWMLMRRYTEDLLQYFFQGNQLPQWGRRGSFRYMGKRTSISDKEAEETIKKLTEAVHVAIKERENTENIRVIMMLEDGYYPVYRSTEDDQYKAKLPNNLIRLTITQPNNRNPWFDKTLSYANVPPTVAFKMAEIYMKAIASYDEAEA